MRGIAIAALLVGGCAPTFQKALTPSGEPCPDMPIIAAGQTVERPYHRLGPVSSAVDSATEAERLESLRRAACKMGGDAVIEAQNEEMRKPDNSYTTRASGTAVVWRRPPAKPTPLATPAPAPSPTPAPAQPPAK